MCIIRSAIATDAQAMTQLVHNSAAYAGIYRRVILMESISAEYIQQHTARLAENNDQLTGFYTILVPGRGSAGEGELDFMFVADRLQGRGIGRMLVDDLRHTASRLGLTRIQIVSHPPAEAFYQAIGARRVGFIRPRGPVTWIRPLLVLDVR